MTNDKMLEADKPQDDFDTALIDAFVEKAELAEFAEPMTGMDVSLGSLSSRLICDDTRPLLPKTAYLHLGG